MQHSDLSLLKRNLTAISRKYYRGKYPVYSGEYCLSCDITSRLQIMAFGRKVKSPVNCFCYDEQIDAKTYFAYSAKRIRMKSSTSQYLYSVLRQAVHELRYLGNKFAQALLRTPLPRILMICIGLALLITIVPLVLTLFVVFILLKLLLLIVVLTLRKHRNNPSELDYQRRSYDKKS